jgi:hypothetical protein
VVAFPEALDEDSHAWLLPQAIAPEREDPHAGSVARMPAVAVRARRRTLRARPVGRYPPTTIWRSAGRWIRPSTRAS